MSVRRRRKVPELVDPGSDPFEGARFTGVISEGGSRYASLYRVLRGQISTLFFRDPIQPVNGTNVTYFAKFPGPARDTTLSAGHNQANREVAPELEPVRVQAVKLRLRFVPKKQCPNAKHGGVLALVLAHQSDGMLPGLPGVTS